MAWRRRAGFGRAGRLSPERRRGGSDQQRAAAVRADRRQLERLGVSPHAFDAVATSGDVTIDLIAERIGDPVLHIGPERDLSLFNAAAEAAGRRPSSCPWKPASYALCTGLRDDVTETPDDYETELGGMAARAMTMICANPDIVIYRGDVLIYCAGALALRYEDLGGPVVYAGKPYPPIYRRALAMAEEAFGAPLDRRRVLAIGDGMKTDIAGAAVAGTRRASHHPRHPSGGAARRRPRESCEPCRAQASLRRALALAGGRDRRVANLNGRGLDVQGSYVILTPLPEP